MLGRSYEADFDDADEDSYLLQDGDETAVREACKKGGSANEDMHWIKNLHVFGPDGQDRFSAKLAILGGIVTGCILLLTYLVGILPSWDRNTGLVSEIHTALYSNGQTLDMSQQLLDSPYLYVTTIHFLPLFGLAVISASIKAWKSGNNSGTPENKFIFVFTALLALVGAFVLCLVLFAFPPLHHSNVFFHLHQPVSILSAGFLALAVVCLVLLLVEGPFSSIQWQNKILLLSFTCSILFALWSAILSFEAMKCNEASFGETPFVEANLGVALLSTLFCITSLAYDITQSHPWYSPMLFYSSLVPLICAIAAATWTVVTSTPFSPPPTCLGFHSSHGFYPLLPLIVPCFFCHSPSSSPSEPLPEHSTSDQ